MDQAPRGFNFLCDASKDIKIVVKFKWSCWNGLTCKEHKNDGFGMKQQSVLFAVPFFCCITGWVLLSRFDVKF